MMAATEITLVTPITIPRIVSADRILRERSVSIATSRFSLSSYYVMIHPPGASLGAQRHYRIQLGCLDCRVDAKEQPDDRAQHHPQHRDPRLNGRGKTSQFAERQRAAEPDRHAHAAAGQALQHALHQELPQHIRLLAPTARLTPISLVRSVTLTSITFMITIPPTTAEIELTITNTAKNAELMLFHREM